MNTFFTLTQRNTKLFFKDKGLFLTSLVTPMILILLFITFLGNVYRDSLKAFIPAELSVPNDLIEGFVGGWLFSSLLAVCCVTISFCSNLLMVQDKVTGAYTDLTTSPLKRSVLALSYYISTCASTLIICFTAFGICLIYLSQTGFFLSLQDILLTCLDVFLLVLFGTALSSVVNFFLSTQGQISAVSAIISSAYGFICGAYIPVSQFSDGIRKFISFLPGTYGTSLLHNHLLRGAISELEKNYLPAEAISGIKTAFDTGVEFFDHTVTETETYIILSCSVLILIAVYVGLNYAHSLKRKV